MVAPTDESWYCSPALQASVHLSVLLEKSQKEEITKGFSAKHESHCHEGSVDMEGKEWQRRDPADLSPEASQSPGPHTLHCIKSSESFFVWNLQKA